VYWIPLVPPDGECRAGGEGEDAVARTRGMLSMLDWRCQVTGGQDRHVTLGRVIIRSCRPPGCRRGRH